MKLKRIFIVTASFLLFSSLAAQDEEAYSSWFMVMNLYPEALDVQLGEEEPVSFKNLTSGSPSLLSKVDPYREYNLYVKLASETTWRFFKTSQGEAKKFRFLPTVPYVLRIAPDGSFSVLSLLVQQGQGAKVALINASDQTAGDFSLTPLNGSAKTRIRAATLAPADMTGFTSLEKGTYEGTVLLGDTRYSLKGSVEGTEGLLNPKDSKWYLAVAKSGAASSTEQNNSKPYFIEIWDVSPF